MRTPILCSLLLITACATSGEETETYENVTDDPRVGEEVPRLCFQRSISGFSEYGDGDGVILRRGASDRFLVTFAGACPGADSVQRIGLTGELSGGGCIRQSSRIFLSDSFTGRGTSPFSTTSCLVKDIYVYDPKAGSEEKEEAAE